MSKLSAAAYLKQSTLAAHRKTESAANSKLIIQGRVGVPYYRQLIQANYRVWQTLEQKLHHLIQHSDESLGWSTYYLGFSKQLKADLIACSVSPTLMEEAEDDLDWAEEATALGVLYVLNGSTLGGKYLYRALRDNEQLARIEHFHFYRACSEVPPRHWLEFKQYLDERLSTTHQQERATAAALSVFAMFTKAYETRLN